MSSVTNAQRALWACSQLYQHRPDPGNPLALASLAHRLQNTYQKKFPASPQNLFNLLFLCQTQRQKQIKRIETDQGSLEMPTSGIDYAALIKKTLGHNPLLSHGDGKERKKTFLSTHRQSYARALSESAFWIEGRALAEGDLVEELATIQQHLVCNKEESQLGHFEREISPSLLLLFHLLAIDLNIADPAEQRERDMLREGAAFFDAIKETPLIHITLEAECQVAASCQDTPGTLWPDLIGKEELLETLFAVEIQTEPNCIPFLFLVRKWLGVLAAIQNMVKSNPETPEQTVLDLLSHLNVTPKIRDALLKKWPEAVPSSEIPLIGQLRAYLFAHRPFRDKHFPVPPRIQRIIQILTTQMMIDYPGEDQSRRGHRIYFLLDGVCNSLKRYDALPPRFVRQFALQGILSLADSQCYSPFLFNPKSALFQIVSSLFHDNPLPCRKEIIAAAIGSYCEKHPLPKEYRASCEFFAHRYFDFLWFHPEQTSSHHLVPTLDLFLEWHATRLLLKEPLLSDSALSERLVQIADEQLPLFPVDKETNIATAICAARRSIDTLKII